MNIKEGLLKKTVLTIFFLLASTGIAHAQRSIVATLSAADSSTTGDCPTPNACVVLPMTDSAGSAAFAIGANASGNTIQFEASADYKSNWVPFLVYPSNSTTGVTSTTSVGPATFSASAGSYTHVRMRISTFVSGTATTRINQSPASASSGRGGSGGSAFPVTVTGGVSGGIPCFTSTTTEAASTLLAANQPVIGGGAGACPTTLATPVPPTGVNDIAINNGTATSWGVPGVTWRTVSIASDTILSSDRGNCVTYSNGGAIAVTVPQAGSANFTAGFNFCVKTIAAGTATLTTSAGQIAGSNGTLGASISVPAGNTAYCYTDSSGANYQCSVSGSGITGLTTNFLLKATNSTTPGNSNCDEGQTTAGVLTCAESNGEAFPVGPLTVETSPCTGLTAATNGAGGICSHVGAAPTGMPASSATLTPTTATCWDMLEVAVDEGCLATGSIVRITGADWTCGTGGTVSSCVAATTIGTFTFTLPLSALNVSVDCNLIVGQATAATLNSWNIQTATNGATNLTAGYSMFTAPTTVANGAVTDVASTTTTQVIAPTWQLTSTATKMNVHIWATIEGASASGTVINIQLVAPTVADLVTIYRGSECHDRIF